MDPSAVAPRAAHSIRTHGASETRAFGRRLGRAAQPGTVLALIGPLGAGKTQLAKGVAEGLDVRSVVNSPTFILMNEHEGRLHLFHIDAYRLDDPEEALAAGLLDDRQAGGVTVVEWADRLSGWLPQDRLDITIAAVVGEERSRSLQLVPRGDAHARLLEAAAGERG